MAAQIFLAVEFAPVVAIRGNADECNLSSARAPVRRANRVDKAGTLTIAACVTVICLTSEKITGVHGSKVSKLIIASVELQGIGGT